jgi:hypothetical protein
MEDASALNTVQGFIRFFNISRKTTRRIGNIDTIAGSSKSRNSAKGRDCPRVD